MNKTRATNHALPIGRVSRRAQTTSFRSRCSSQVAANWPDSGGGNTFSRATWRTFRAPASRRPTWRRARSICRPRRAPFAEEFPSNEQVSRRRRAGKIGAPSVALASRKLGRPAAVSRRQTMPKLLGIRGAINIARADNVIKRGLSVALMRSIARKKVEDFCRLKITKVN